jgi:hypothetical protein
MFFLPTLSWSGPNRMGNRTAIRTGNRIACRRSIFILYRELYTHPICSKSNGDSYGKSYTCRRPLMTTSRQFKGSSSSSCCCLLIWLWVVAEPSTNERGRGQMFDHTPKLLTIRKPSLFALYQQDLPPTLQCSGGKFSRQGWHFTYLFKLLLSNDHQTFQICCFVLVTLQVLPCMGLNLLWRRVSSHSQNGETGQGKRREKTFGFAPRHAPHIFTKKLWFVGTDLYVTFMDNDTMYVPGMYIQYVCMYVFISEQCLVWYTNCGMLLGKPTCNDVSYCALLLLNVIFHRISWRISFFHIGVG